MFVTNSLLLIVLSVVVLVVMSPLLALLCLIALPVVIVASVRFQRASNEAYLAVRDRIGQTLSTLQEGLSGVRVIQAFGREDVAGAALRRAQPGPARRPHATRSRSRPGTSRSSSSPASATTAAVVGIGGVLVHRDVVTVGTVAAFVLYLTNLFEPIQQLQPAVQPACSRRARRWPSCSACSTRASTVAERPGAVDLPAAASIEVDGRRLLLRRRRRRCWPTST